MTADAKATQDELIELQNAWMDAWRRGDEPRLREIIGDEFTLTSARSDRLMDKSEWLALATGGRVVAESFDYRDFRVQPYGEVAIVKSRMRQKATVDGAPWDAEFMLTDVWIRRDGRWQVVARHSSTSPSVAFTATTEPDR